MPFRMRLRKTKTLEQLFQGEQIPRKYFPRKKKIQKQKTFLQVTKTCQKCDFWNLRAKAISAIFLNIFLEQYNPSNSTLTFCHSCAFTS